MTAATPHDYLAATVADSLDGAPLTDEQAAWLDRVGAAHATDEARFREVDGALAQATVELEAMCATYHHDPPRLWRLAARLRTARETLAEMKGED